MGEETLSTDELDTLLEGAEIISDDTGNYAVTSQESGDLEDVGNESSEPEVVTSTSEEVSEAHEIVLSEIIDVDKLSPQQRHNAELLLDIYVSVTVELGRTNYKVKDILGLGEGSIVELAKPASEPVDLLVNNRLIARGEVVVIDENFGARVTNIVKPLEKLIPE
ncbi:MAG: hypothetical protein IEMM0008_0070 [bacterium]|nr:MAG: hypothetical protein IEMM0008_0070 [bacterium]